MYYKLGSMHPDKVIETARLELAVVEEESPKLLEGKVNTVHTDFVVKGEPVPDFLKKDILPLKDYLMSLACFSYGEVGVEDKGVWSDI